MLAIFASPLKSSPDEKAAHQRRFNIAIQHGNRHIPESGKREWCKYFFSFGHFCDFALSTLLLLGSWNFSNQCKISLLFLWFEIFTWAKKALMSYWVSYMGLIFHAPCTTTEMTPYDFSKWNWVMKGEQQQRREFFLDALTIFFDFTRFNNFRTFFSV